MCVTIGDVDNAAEVQRDVYIAIRPQREGTRMPGAPVAPPSAPLLPEHSCSCCGNPLGLRTCRTYSERRLCGPAFQGDAGLSPSLCRAVCLRWRDMHGCATEAKALNVPKLCMHMHMHMHMHIMFMCRYGQEHEVRPILGRCATSSLFKVE